MIPKIIHYCWFGRGEKSPLAERCMQSWRILTEQGYSLQEWNESNSNLEENKAVYQAYLNKQYAFVSDYVRLKALFQMGGLYLDTDVEVFQDFTPLFNCNLLLGMIYDASIGTAVIGSMPGNHYIGKLIECYDTAHYPEPDSGYRYYVFQDYPEHSRRMVNNNDLFTLFFFTQAPWLRFGKNKVEFDGVHIYPKHYFEGETLREKNNYARHYGEGSWYQRQDTASGIRQTVKFKLVKRFRIMRVLRDQIYRYRHNKRVPFYRFHRL